MSKQSAQADTLSRKVVLHVTANGIVTIGPVTGPGARDGVDVGHWREMVTDMVLANNFPAAVELAQTMDSHRADDVYSLPVFSTDNIEQAKMLRIMTCRMVSYPRAIDDGIEYSIEGRPRHLYVLNVFDGTLDDMQRITKLMQNLYDSHLVGLE